MLFHACSAFDRFSPRAVGEGGGPEGVSGRYDQGSTVRYMAIDEFCSCNARNYPLMRYGIRETLIDH